MYASLSSKAMKKTEKFLLIYSVILVKQSQVFEHQLGSRFFAGFLFSFPLLLSLFGLGGQWCEVLGLTGHHVVQIVLLREIIAAKDLFLASLEGESLIDAGNLRLSVRVDRESALLCVFIQFCRSSGLLSQLANHFVLVELRLD